MVHLRQHTETLPNFNSPFPHTDILKRSYEVSRQPLPAFTENIFISALKGQQTQNPETITEKNQGMPSQRIILLTAGPADRHSVHTDRLN